MPASRNITDETKEVWPEDRGKPKNATKAPDVDLARGMDTGLPAVGSLPGSPGGGTGSTTGSSGSMSGMPSGDTGSASAQDTDQVGTGLADRDNAGAFGLTGRDNSESADVAGREDAGTLRDTDEEQPAERAKK